MKPYPEKTKLAALSLYRTGLSHRAVAKQLGLSQKTIQRWVSYAGIPRPVKKHPAEIRQKALSLFQDTGDYKQIAEDLNISRRIIHQWLKQDGIVLKPRVGPLSSQWKGGVSSKNALIRNSKQMREWRLNVFERDGYTCLSCGKTGGYIEAHHILSFANYPESRFDTKNGATLCEECHLRVHGKIRRSKVAV